MKKKIPNMAVSRPGDWVVLAFPLLYDKYLASKMYMGLNAPFTHLLVIFGFLKRNKLRNGYESLPE